MAGTAFRLIFNFEMKILLIVLCLILGGCVSTQNQDSLDSVEPILPTTTPQEGEKNQQSTVLPKPSPMGHPESQPAKAIEPLPQISPPPVDPSQESTPLPAVDSSPENTSLNSSYSVLDEFGKPQFSLKSSEVFSSASLPSLSISFDERDLLTVLVNTRAYFINHHQQDPQVLRGGLLEQNGVTVADIMETLNFMIQVLHEDITVNRVTRLKDPQFIEENFQTIRWSPYNPDDLGQEKVRITQYAIFTHPGSRTQTLIYDTPLYRLNLELNSDNIETRYSKQDVISGVYESGGEAYGRAIPLAYLTRDALEEALLQGTILINFEDGSSSYFNVDVNNGIAYVKGMAQKEQKRYWYFKEVDSIKGYGYQSQAKISVLPGVTFAGDISNIGLGRIIVLDTFVEGERRLQIGVIADTGGAFRPNLYQLDYLAGIFPSRAAFSDYARQYSDYATAYLLIRRR